MQLLIPGTGSFAHTVQVIHTFSILEKLLVLGKSKIHPILYSPYFGKVKTSPVCSGSCELKTPYNRQSSIACVIRWVYTAQLLLGIITRCPWSLSYNTNKNSIYTTNQNQKI